MSVPANQVEGFDPVSVVTEDHSCYILLVRTSQSTCTFKGAIGPPSQGEECRSRLVRTRGMGELVAALFEIYNLPRS